jgi:hypothetical protein
MEFISCQAWPTDVKPLVSITPLVDFLMHLEDYIPMIPDVVTGYYLNQDVFEVSNPQIVVQKIHLRYCRRGPTALQNERYELLQVVKQK